MSKTKNYYWDCAEKESDSIILEFCEGKISYDVAKNKLSNVDGIELVGIDEYNVDEVLDAELERYKDFLNKETA
tara:strand:+ start:106 stop:327 length:222 start_codon:yes stop_codon:yes gene_type:complete